MKFLHPGDDWSVNHYTGANRFGGTLNINDVSGHADVVTLRALSSGAGLDYGRAAYQTQLGRATTGVAYAYMHYSLGKDFSSLDAHGTAATTSLFGSYPLLRSRNSNLYALLDLDAKSFRDEVDTTATTASKKARVAMLSLNGDTRDTLAGGGLNAYSLTWTSGTIDLQSAEARAADAATAGSDGHYDKLSLHAARLQRVTDSLSLYAALNGQIASTNLDVSEKLALGGAGAVRAYSADEAYGDQGYLLNLEARQLLAQLSEHVPGQVQLIGFVDSGSVQLNQDRWAPGRNRRTLSGAGIGLNWTDNGSFGVNAFVARRLGSERATSGPDATSRFWIEAIKYL
ncbi:MAG TPA: ShlB/FhaC/HecB family hemolysin secretion/activation protein [Steroidobacteraceae bacterium]